MGCSYLVNLVASVTNLTIQSDYWNVVSWVEPVVHAEFEDEAPEQGELKVLKFRIKDLTVPGSEDEG